MAVLLYDMIHCILTKYLQVFSMEVPLFGTGELDS